MRMYVIKKGNKYVDHKRSGYTKMLIRALLCKFKGDAEYEIVGESESVVPVEVTVKEVK